MIRFNKSITLSISSTNVTTSKDKMNGTMCSFQDVARKDLHRHIPIICMASSSLMILTEPSFVALSSLEPGLFPTIR